MRRLLTLAGLLGILGLGGLAPTLAHAGATTVEMSFERGTVDVTIGDRFTLSTMVENIGAAPTEPFVAHLNVASLTNDVYVDPEDWSANRSVDLPLIPPGARTTVDWELQAVNPGTFDVYVVLLPSGATSSPGPLTVSPPVRVAVAPRQSISAGGTLPVAVAVPIILGLVAVAARLRHRRTG